MKYVVTGYCLVPAKTTAVVSATSAADAIRTAERMWHVIPAEKRAKAFQITVADRLADAENYKASEAGAAEWNHHDDWVFISEHMAKGGGAA
ncbi:MAG: hypothetical protein LBC18_03165 [Opitutaceae bacterium]|jgi:hypothetical protein|nr:hypothetical protein [Opitutaceae bacterium]